MRRLVEQTREATRGGTGSNSSMRLVVQRYWRKLANPGALRDHGRHPKSSGTLSVQETVVWTSNIRRPASPGDDRVPAQSCGPHVNEEPRTKL
jgi:hypothetical protein